MFKKTNSALAILAIAAVSIVGCGTEDLTELNDTWTKAENDLNTQLSDVKSAHAEIMTKFQSIPAANTSDSTAVQDHQMTQDMLQNHEKMVGEVETKFNELKASREAAFAGGKKAEFEVAWTAAKAEYEACMAKLEQVKADHGTINDKVSKMSATSTMANDTVVAPVTDTTTH